MRLACYEDFETPDGLYWPPYEDYAAFNMRAQQIADLGKGGPILIAGCGFGYTVRHCRNLGLDAWGCDASPYALERSVSSQVFHHDVTQSYDRQWGLIVTEDVLPMLSRGEIELALTSARNAAEEVLHVITAAPVDPHPSIVTALNKDEWTVMVSPDLAWVY